MLISDRPIQNLSQDELGRSNFVRSLARTTISNQDTKSIVIALNGPLGAGKSSLLQMLADELRQFKKYTVTSERPVVVAFDPWYYSDRSDLVEAFLNTLLIELKKCDYLPNLKQISKLLTKYIAQLSKTARITENNSLPGLKTKISALLAKNKNKVIITIDNISRLNHSEILQLLQILKCFADFSNTVYVLSFDKKAIVDALDQLHQTNSEEYLDKIVQIYFDIPSASPQTLATILLRSLNQILHTAGQKEWEQSDWERLYQSGFKHLFHTMRDVTRYLNTVNFSLQWQETLVNRIDLFAITALQVLLSDLYNAIRDNKDLFTFAMEAPFPDQGLYIQQQKARCDAILNHDYKIPAAALHEFLTAIFPKMEFIYNQVTFTEEDKAEWRRTHRICDPDTFERFFAITVATDHMSTEEASAIVANITNQEVFSNTLKSLVVNKRPISFFEFFEEYLPKAIKNENIPTAIFAVLDTADILPEFDKTFSNLNIAERVYQIVKQLLKTLPTIEQRASALTAAMNQLTLSIYVPMYIVAKFSNPAATSGKSFTKPQIDTWQNILINQVDAWGKENRLIEHPHLMDILDMWQDWTQYGKDNKLIINLIATDENLIKFLVAFLRPAIFAFINDLTRKSSWETDVKRIGEFISLNKIEPRVGKLFEDSAAFRRLREHEQVAIMIFLDKLQPEWSIRCVS